jgi:hypothetical protein
MQIIFSSRRYMRQCSKNVTIRAILFAALILSPWTVRAQSASCPIQPTQAKNVNSQIGIDFTNLSGKPIHSYRFALTFFDLNGKAHVFPQPLAGNVQIASHAHRSAIWQTGLATRFLYPYAQAFLQQVIFTDGTSWLDDGSHSCSIISVQE